MFCNPKRDIQIISHTFSQHVSTYKNIQVLNRHREKKYVYRHVERKEKQRKEKER
jgi:hypothetical protein